MKLSAYTCVRQLLFFFSFSSRETFSPYNTIFWISTAVNYRQHNPGNSFMSCGRWDSSASTERHHPRQSCHWYRGKLLSLLLNCSSRKRGKWALISTSFPKRDVLPTFCHGPSQHLITPPLLMTEEAQIEKNTWPFKHFLCTGTWWSTSE